jgi:hypothetical protein
MKTFCKFVGELDREPKDVIMVSEKNVTLAEYFHSLGIITPEVKPLVASAIDAHEDMEGEGREDDEDLEETMGASGASERSRHLCHKDRLGGKVAMGIRSTVVEGMRRVASTATLSLANSRQTSSWEVSQRGARTSNLIWKPTTGTPLPRDAV